jgi:hypothetical protein
VEREGGAAVRPHNIKKAAARLMYKRVVILGDVGQEYTGERRFFGSRLLMEQACVAEKFKVLWRG